MAGREDEGDAPMSSADGRVAMTSPVPREVWEAALRSDQGAVVSQSLAWSDAVFASGRLEDVSVLYEFSSGRQVVLPLARRRGRPPRTAAIGVLAAHLGGRRPDLPGGAGEPG